MHPSRKDMWFLDQEAFPNFFQRDFKKNVSPAWTTILSILAHVVQNDTLKTPSQEEKRKKTLGVLGFHFENEAKNPQQF